MQQVCWLLHSLALHSGGTEVTADSWNTERKWKQRQGKQNRSVAALLRRKPRTTNAKSKTSR